jgi:hypothetical protein
MAVKKNLKNQLNWENKKIIEKTESRKETELTD